MKIRSAIISDSDEIGALAAELGYSGDREQIRSRLARLVERADHLIVVAIHENKIEGWMHARASLGLASGSAVEVVSLVVSWRCRRRGIGASLVRRAEIWGNNLHAGTIVARSDAKRAESRGFFPAAGYILTNMQAVYRKQLRQPVEQSA